MYKVNLYSDVWEDQRKPPGDNSVVRLGMISLRWVTVMIGNQMQIRITCV